jgi:Uncharacterized membrane protein, required for colicin V production
MNLTNLFLSVNITDLIILATILLSALISLARGLVKELLSITTWIMATWLAIKFNSNLSSAIGNYLDDPTVCQITGFVLVLISVLLLGTIVNYLVSLLVTSTGLSKTDRVLGTFFGTLRGALLVTISLLLTSYTSFTNEKWWQESILIPYFEQPIELLKDGFLNKIPHWNPTATTILPSSEESTNDQTIAD